MQILHQISAMRSVSDPMRSMSRPMRNSGAQAQESKATGRFITPTMRRVAGGGSLTLLSILFYLIVYQNLPTSLHGTTIKPLDTGGLLDQIIKIGAIVISGSIIVVKWSLVRQLARNINVGLAAFMVLIPMSMQWSIDSNATLRKFLSLTTIVLICYAITLVGWDRRRFQHVATFPAMFILVSSLILGLVSPDMVKELGTDLSLKDAWHGITYQKNQFGMMASVGAIICVNRWLIRGGGSVWYVAGTAIAFTCLLLSRSSTSLFATMLAIFFMILVMRVPVVKQRFSTLLVVGLATTILVYELAVQNIIPGSSILLKPITSLTGKDMTFSSRTAIWNILKTHMEYWPWLGAGYGAYWQVIPGIPDTPSYIFMHLLQFYPSEAHNGYLEIMNELGRVGLIVLLLYVIWFIRQALQLMRYDRSQAALYLALLFQQMVTNLSESEWLSRSTVCAILLLATTCLSRDVHEHLRHAKLATPARRSR
jgi:exopolysaccharide production protein ExoQ